jgi:hypothetical protein
MTILPVTLVCGFGRCGSSLVMQMLRAGGMAVTGNWPAFEAEQANGAAFNAAWVSQQHGSAVKVLDIHRPEIALPAGQYRSIWLDRDPYQQALSHAKFVRIMFGLPMDRAHRRRFERSLIEDRPAAIAALRNLGPVLCIRFETILARPLDAAADIAAFCELPAGAIHSMAATVLSRNSDATPDLAIELALLERAA